MVTKMIAEMIAPGDPLTHASLKGVGEKGMEAVDTQALFAHRKSLLFGLPGAFTPLCSATHVPGFVEKSAQFRKKGIDRVVCVAVNDPFVLAAWKDALGVTDEIFFLSDGNNTWLKSMGLTFDGGSFLLGERSKRFAMVVQNGIVQSLEIEESPGVCEKTSGASMLDGLSFV